MQTVQFVNNNKKAKLYKSHVRAMQGVLPSFKVDAHKQLDLLGIKSKSLQDDIINLSGYEYIHMLLPSATTADMMLACTRNLLAHENISTSEIDAIISITQSPDYLSPGNSFFYLHHLGIDRNCICLDLFDDGSGLINALLMSSTLIASGASKRLLLIAGDCARLTTMRSGHMIAPLIGDGGGVLIIERDNDNNHCPTLSNFYFDFLHPCITNKKNTWNYNLTASHREPSIDALNHATPRVDLAKISKSFCKNPITNNFKIKDNDFIVQFKQNIAVNTINSINNLLVQNSMHYSDLGAAICAPLSKNLLKIIISQCNLCSDNDSNLRTHDLFKFLNRDLGHINSGAILTAISHNLTTLKDIHKKPSLLIGFGASLSIGMAIINLSRTNLYPIFSFD